MMGWASKRYDKHATILTLTFRHVTMNLNAIHVTFSLTSYAWAQFSRAAVDAFGGSWAKESARFSGR